jgi:lysophospholipid hydrolase
MVQVFARADHSSDCKESLWDEDDMNGYQLLNEVGSGGTLSSLFTILSLFTEDVPMSWQDDDPQVTTNATAECEFETPPIQHRTRRANSDVSHLDLSSKSPKSPGRTTPRRSSTSSTTSTVRSPAAPPSPTESLPVMVEATSPPHRRAHLQSQVHQGVIARATVDSTLAVIPAEAFRRLTKNFPKASSHIVQGISETLSS